MCSFGTGYPHHGRAGVSGDNDEATTVQTRGNLCKGDSEVNDRSKVMQPQLYPDLFPRLNQAYDPIGKCEKRSDLVVLVVRPAWF